MKFSKRVQAIQVSAIKQMPLIAQKYPGAISLGQGIPSFPTPSFITDAIAEFLKSNPNSGKYSLQPGTIKLREAVARDIEAQTGAIYNPITEIAITCGAMEALAITVSTLVDRGDKVALPDPCYGSHIEQVLFAEGKPCFFPLIDTPTVGWSVDLDALSTLCAAKDIEVIVISNPSNPTGMILSLAEMERIVQIVKDSGAILIADETYDFLTYDGIKFRSFATFHDIRDQLVLINSFSKRFCMTGYRVGYVCAPPQLIEQVLKVHDAFAICAPTISQYGAEIALLESQKDSGKGAAFAEMMRSNLQTRRDLLCDGIKDLPAFCRAEKPQGAYYLFAKLAEEIVGSAWWTSSFGLAEKILKEAGVIVIPGSAFGPNSHKYLRFSFGGEERDLVEALDRLRKWVCTLS